MRSAVSLLGQTMGHIRKSQMAQWISSSIVSVR